MSHQEKQEIFDEYFKSINRVNVDCFLASFGVHEMLRSNLIKHIFAACDLVQEEQQKRIADKALMRHDYNDLNNLEAGRSQKRFIASGLTYYNVDKSSIINPENLIK
ncbi:hypothetical protein EG359_17325 [Chryseobacterium joostei]|uniref:Uncharacterized protein n=1 Tax=Chryseobacterium joostei TaxID=112234 RepID=A0A1N7IB02_9FLAO|nr:hypothetical protein [Chryseobacterium joostei]AZB01265.1 hypothetical protein EG359_17325 [Chryseobacterium joostei]SIS34249.1 hypothetical protein SAMN05421768_103664 [Chryseobacterium joostei]